MFSSNNRDKTLVTLPDDILNLITSELWQDRDFDTLYHFARCSRQFAALALAYLYRMQDVAPVKASSESDSTRIRNTVAEKNKTRKWAVLWRSILLSAQPGKTIFPYSRYIRVLELQDFELLLHDLNTQLFVELQNELFVKDLKHLKKTHKGKVGYTQKGKLDVDSIAELAGQEILQCTPLLEELGGNLPARVLSKYIPGITRLKTLRLWDGHGLDTCAEAIRQNCPDFRNIFALNWCGGDDENVEFIRFLEKIQPICLQSVEIQSFNELGRSFRALGHHGSSLTDVTLHELTNEALSAPPGAGETPLLENLYLKMRHGFPDFSIATAENIKKNSEWLTSCVKLKSLKFDGLVFAPQLIQEIFQTPAICLESLELRLEVNTSDKPFLNALSRQKSLNSLVLALGEMGELKYSLDTFVKSICSLTNLRRLRLVDISDTFKFGHHQEIVVSLRKLEELWIGGVLEDAMLTLFSGLPCLKNLGLTGIGSLSTDGIIKFISRSPEGIQLEILAIIKHRGVTLKDIKDAPELEKAISAKGVVFTSGHGPMGDIYTSDSSDEDDIIFASLL